MQYTLLSFLLKNSSSRNLFRKATANILFLETLYVHNKESEKHFKKLFSSYISYAIKALRKSIYVYYEEERCWRIVFLFFFVAFFSILVINRFFVLNFFFSILIWNIVLFQTAIRYNFFTTFTIKLYVGGGKNFNTYSACGEYVWGRGGEELGKNIYRAIVRTFIHWCNINNFFFFFDDAS